MKKTERVKETIRRGKELMKMYAPEILMISAFAVGGFVVGALERPDKKEEDEFGDFERSVAKRISKAIELSGDSGLRWMEYQKGLGGVVNDEVSQLRIKDLGEFGNAEIEMGVNPDQDLMYVFACGKKET